MRPTPPRRRPAPAAAHDRRRRPGRPARTGHSGRLGRLGDVGAATVEHTGLALVVVGIVAALVAVPVGPRLADALRQVVCQITGGDCAATTAWTPECVISTQGESVARSLGAETTRGVVLAGSVSAEDGSRIELVGDGSARLITSNGVGVEGYGGLGEEAAVGDVVVGATARLGVDVVGRTQAVRTFDSVEQAQRYRDESYGLRQRATDVVSGLGGAERAAQLDSALDVVWERDDPHPPDAYRAVVAPELDAPARAAGGPLVSAETGVAVGGSGTLEWSTTGEGVTYTGQVSPTLMAGAGVMDLGGSAEGAYSVGSSIHVDEDLELTDITFIADAENTTARGLDPATAGTTVTGARSTGTATTWQHRLALDDEADRRTVEALLPQLTGPGLAPDAAQRRALGVLDERLRRNSVETRARWLVDSTESSSTWPLPRGLPTVSSTTTTGGRTLQDFTMRDLSQSDQTWKPVPSCP